MSETNPNQTTDEHEEQGPATVMSMMGSADGDQPLGLEEDNEETGEGGGWSVSSSAIVVGIVALVLLVAVVMLRQMQTAELDQAGVSPKLAAKVNQYIGTASAAAGEQSTGDSAMNKDTDAILAMFSRDLSDKQVPIEYIKKNPFRLSLPEPETTEQEADDQPDGPSERELKLKKLNKQLKKLELQSIMGGGQPVAVINGNLYQRGDTVGSFTLAEVSRLKVTLKAAGETFSLTMEEQAGRE